MKEQVEGHYSSYDRLDAALALARQRLAIALALNGQIDGKMMCNIYRSATEDQNQINRDRESHLNETDDGPSDSLATLLFKIKPNPIFPDKKFHLPL